MLKLSTATVLLLLCFGSMVVESMHDGSDRARRELAEEPEKPKAEIYEEREEKIREGVINSALKVEKDIFGAENKVEKEVIKEEKKLVHAEKRMEDHLKDFTDSASNFVNDLGGRFIRFARSVRKAIENGGSTPTISAKDDDKKNKVNV